jgi:hypothetical protein
VASKGLTSRFPGAKIGKRVIMSYPTSPHLPPQHPSAAAAAPAGRASAAAPSRPHLPGQLPDEGEHQLEKLEFSLAVALTRGDTHRSAQLREQIAALGGNREEPGT